MSTFTAGQRVRVTDAYTWHEAEEPDEHKVVGELGVVVEQRGDFVKVALDNNPFPEEIPLWHFRVEELEAV